ncbi:MAG: Hsp20/alpha crystallin family protein [Pseudomonadota bacterium]
MKRSIPSITMKDVSRAQRKRQKKGPRIRLSSNVGLQVNFGGDRASRSEPAGRLTAPAFPTGLFKKPRNWKFQTKPLFKKIKGPLVDVFREAEEVLIVIDLGGFRKEDVCLSVQAGRYSIVAKRGEQEFIEDITLPTEVDFKRHVANFKNGVLEIVLPRKKETTD